MFWYHHSQARWEKLMENEKWIVFLESQYFNLSPESNHPPTSSYLSQPCLLVFETPPFRLLIYQLVGNSKILPPKLHPQ